MGRSESPAPACADRAEHVFQLRLDLAAEAGDFLGDINELEELLRINRATSHIIAVDTHHVAAADFEARAGVHKRLKREVDQVYGFNLGGGFDLDDVPRVLRDRIQNIHAGHPAIVHETCLEQRLPFPDGLQRILEHLLEIRRIRADLDATGVKCFGQSADFMALVEDGLLRGVRFGDLVFGVVGVPKKFPTLAAPETFRLGNVGPLSGGVEYDAAHDLPNARVAASVQDAGSAQFKDERALNPVFATADDAQFVALDFDAALAENLSDLLGGSLIVSGEIKGSSR